MAFCSAKLDEVSRNKIVEEAIKREQKAANGRMATEFQVPDPRRSEFKYAWQLTATYTSHVSTEWRCISWPTCHQKTMCSDAAVHILPDKPNYTIPAIQPTEQQLQEAHDKLLHLTCVKHIEQTPSQIFSLPITANMEYGFCAAPLVSCSFYAANEQADSILSNQPECILLIHIHTLMHICYHSCPTIDAYIPVVSMHVLYIAIHADEQSILLMHLLLLLPC